MQQLDYKPHEALRAAMRANNLNAPSLAKRLNVTTTYIYQLSKGDREITGEMAIRLDNELGVPFEQLSPELAALLNKASDIRKSRNKRIAQSITSVAPNDDERTQKADKRTKPAKTETTQAPTGESHAAQ